MLKNPENASTLYLKAVQRNNHATTATKLNRSYNRMIINLFNNGTNDPKKIASIVSLHAKGKISVSRVIYWIKQLELFPMVSNSKGFKMKQTILNENSRRIQCLETQKIITSFKFVKLTDHKNHRLFIYKF